MNFVPKILHKVHPTQIHSQFYLYFSTGHGPWGVVDRPYVRPFQLMPGPMCTMTEEVMLIMPRSGRFMPARSQALHLKSSMSDLLEDGSLVNLS